MMTIPHVFAPPDDVMSKSFCEGSSTGFSSGLISVIAANSTLNAPTVMAMRLRNAISSPQKNANAP